MMNLTSLTEASLECMGPEDGLPSNNILPPPRLLPDTNELMWKASVMEWTENLKACATG